MKYLELKQKLEKELNEFPIIFAFTDDGLYRGMATLGLSPDDTHLMTGIGGGGYVRRTDLPDLLKMQTRHEEELATAMEDDEFLFDAFKYELANHEFGITFEPEETLSALNLTATKVWEDLRMRNIFTKAKVKYLEEFEECNR
jgi:hypothetical protein